LEKKKDELKHETTTENLPKMPPTKSRGNFNNKVGRIKVIDILF
jgi:hypothetical protein